jgi:hypothetical protein
MTFFYYIRKKLTSLKLQKVNGKDEDGANVVLFVNENQSEIDKHKRFENEATLEITFMNGNTNI